MSSLRQRSRDAQTINRTPHEDKNRKSPPRKTYTTLIILVSAVAIAFVLLAQTTQTLNSAAFWKDGTPPQDSYGKHRNAFKLHPEDHVYREPTVQKRRWQITRCTRRPDGVLKQVYCINDQFPGPTLEARSGDRLVIDIVNAIDGEGLAMHWHGLSMHGGNNMDGAAGITQAPIAPGATFRYEFNISDEQYGTFWYHAHSAVQRSEGLFGGLVVHQPVETDERVKLDSETLLMAGDWYHRTAADALDFYMHPGSYGNEPVPDGLLLNGIGFFDCSNIVPARPVDCVLRTSGFPELQLDQEVRNVIRLVNTGSYAGISLRIRGAMITPIRVDGNNMVSGSAARSVGVLHPGERIDLIIEPTPKSQEEQFLEFTIDDTPFKYPNQVLSLDHQFPVKWSKLGNAALKAQGGVVETLDVQTLTAGSGAFPLPPAQADDMIVLYATTQKLVHMENAPRGFINNTSWQPSVIPLTSSDRAEWDQNQFVPEIERGIGATRWVDIVLNNLDDEGHPFHMHGHQFWVLSTYTSRIWGAYNPFEDADPPGGAYGIDGAVRKDTVYVPKRGYAVLRVPFDNPGIWMFHCHNQWHQASGMSMAFQVI